MFFRQTTEAAVVFAALYADRPGQFLAQSDKPTGIGLLAQDSKAGRFLGHAKKRGGLGTMAEQVKCGPIANA